MIKGCSEHTISVSGLTLLRTSSPSASAKKTKVFFLLHSSRMAFFSLYPYEPSRVLPIVFGVLVTLISLAIFYQSLRHRWYHFCFVLTWASMVWISGFILREISVFNVSNVGLFIAQYLLVFIGPPLYAASEYFILGRMLAYLPYFTPMHPGRVMYIFILLSGAVEGLATSGAANAGNPNATLSVRNAALARVKASLILQEFVEVLFISCVACVEYRCRKAGRFPRNVRIICRVLYTTSVMMMVRCIVRTVEGFEFGTCDPKAPGYKGYCGNVELNEWFLWVFEVANITVFVAALAIWHPSRYLPADRRRYLDPVDGVTERIGPDFRKAQNRSWILTWLDPFNIGGKLRGESTDKYWERENEVADGSFAAPKGNKRTFNLV